MVRDLWNVCLAYGNVIDVYIPIKKSKAGKKFTFVRFIRVDNLDQLIRNLCTIWIGRLRLHANTVQFQIHLLLNIVTESSPAIVLDDACIMERDFSCSLMGKIKDINALSNLFIILANEGFENVKLFYLGGQWVLLELDSVTSKEKITNHMGVGSWFEVLKPACNSFMCEERLVWVAIEGLPVKALTRNTYAKIVASWGELVDINESDKCSLSCIRVCMRTKPCVLINDRVKIIIKGQLHCICVKEQEAWMPEFQTVMEDDTSLDEESERNNENYRGSDNEHVFETSIAHENVDEFQVNPKPSCNTVIFKDLFGIYKILKRNKDTNVTEGDTHTPQYPPGFTPNVEKNVVDNIPRNASQPKPNPTTSGNKEKASSVNDKFQASGSILEVKYRSIMVLKEIAMFVDEFLVLNIQGFGNKALWENLSFDYAFSPSVGYSGGILCVWDPRLFVKDTSTVSDSFLAISGTWISSSTKLLVIYVYAPQLYVRISILSVSRPILLVNWNVDYGLRPCRFSILGLPGKVLNKDGFARFVEAVNDDLFMKVEFVEGKLQDFKISITFDYQFPNQLTPDQIGDLERNVSYEEIKRAVSRGSFPPGCNSSFITLIPKSQEAKMVKDFRPISLIGNFEKAFDSVRWDYLDVVLANFGFGLKWRSWIQGCLNSAMGSILVNGSPTSEFKFSKGLKQGDPLSPFLFILIMESLHLSFNNVVNAGLYNGIQIDESLNLSHLFYADDVIFVGKWNSSNLSTIVKCSKWFMWLWVSQGQS
ncbi:RNA-directed DNA polymerase, eukaryota [Tanacetum coccineum]|uniref:RNA-directed DNA polymerase, eukaryota n=1 Tax=Tanacetum coccineum TaxID=301880 RepID=A0ABQ4Y8T6_9ASTR